MKVIMVFNVILKSVWICAGVVLIIYGHTLTPIYNQIKNRGEQKMRTEKQLIEDGVIKVEKHHYVNATVECFSNGGVKGIWIDGEYYKAIRENGNFGFNI